MNTQPTTNAAAKDSLRAASTLSSDVLDLLAAIRDALDIPLPGLDEADERAQHEVMERRTSGIRSTLATLLDRPGPVNASHVAYIRDRTAETPITYTVWQDPEATTTGGEQA